MSTTRRTRRPSLGSGTSSATEVWVGAARLTAASGAPSTTAQQSHPVWVFDAASAESVSAIVDIPEDWSTVDMDLHWSNNGAGSGSVVWRINPGTLVADGGTIAAPTAKPDVTVAAPAQNVLKVTTVATAVAVDGKLVFRLFRMAADAADTLGNDASLLGVNLRKAS